MSSKKTPTQKMITLLRQDEKTYYEIARLWFPPSVSKIKQIAELRWRSNFRGITKKKAEEIDWTKVAEAFK